VTVRLHAGGRPVAVAVVAAVTTALLIGIPTDVVPTPWFSREIGMRAADVVVLIALSVLSGALAATYAIAGSSGASAPRWNRIGDRRLVRRRLSGLQQARRRPARRLRRHRLVRAGAARARRRRRRARGGRPGDPRARDPTRRLSAAATRLTRPRSRGHREPR
jgi:hypothetical protein